MVFVVCCFEGGVGDWWDVAGGVVAVEEGKMRKWNCDGEKLVFIISSRASPKQEQLLSSSLRRLQCHYGPLKVAV
jgi:hypothetical protein